MIMSETDCPYVTPASHRGKRNEPSYVTEVVKRIAAIKGEGFEKVSEAMANNAIRVFGVSASWLTARVARLKVACFGGFC